MENNNNIICKADIRAQSPIFLKIIEMVITVFGLLWLLPLKKAAYEYMGKKNIFGIYVSGRYAKSFVKPLGLVLLLLGIVIFIYCIAIYNSQKGCILELHSDKIDGNVKSVFLSKSLMIPIENVDCVMVRYGIFDKIFGGETVAICSASAIVKFPFVQNADEFVNATLAKIDELKQQ